MVLKCACGHRSETGKCNASSSGVLSSAFQKSDSKIMINFIAHFIIANRFHSQDLDSMMRQLQSGDSVKIENISIEKLKERV